MKFRVCRTSTNYYSDSLSPPCAGAVRAKFKRFDTRTSKSPEEHDTLMRKRGLREEPWLSKGTEHKILRGPRGGATGIQRRSTDEDGWMVEVADLAALFALSDHDLVVGYRAGACTDMEEDYMPSIEIYDGYRE